MATVTPLFALFLVIKIIFVFAIISNLVIRTTHRKFVREHSIAVKTMKEINNRYKFYLIKNLNQSHTYDNCDYYNEITCRAYFTYYLRDNKDEVETQIRNASINHKMFLKYEKEIKDLNCVGQYNVDNSRYIKIALRKYEKNEIDSLIQYPCTTFKILIFLSCSRMNGNIYSTKSETFWADDAINMLARISNKSGGYYNDKEVWDYLCKVERGKVSNKMRFAIYERDNFICRRCGWNGRNAKNGLEIDHIVPISKGGKSTPDNLQTLCHKCNKLKGSD